MNYVDLSDTRLHLIFSVTVIVAVIVIIPTISTHCQPVFGTLRNSLIHGTTVASLLAAKFTCKKTCQSAVCVAQITRQSSRNGCFGRLIVSFQVRFDMLIDFVEYGYTIGNGNMAGYVLLA